MPPTTSRRSLLPEVWVKTTQTTHKTDIFIRMLILFALLKEKFDVYKLLGLGCVLFELLMSTNNNSKIL